MVLLYLFPLLAIIPAAVIDIKSKRIPNIITFPAMIIGITLTSIFNTQHLAQCVIMMVALFLFGATGLMGLGDIKLLMAVASTSGIMFTITVIGAAVALLLIKELISDFKHTCVEIKTGLFLVATGNTSNADANSKKAPMAAYILAGYLITLAGWVFFNVI